MSLKVVFCAVLLSAVQGITFYAKEGVEKCFSDEIPSRTVLFSRHVDRDCLPLAEVGGCLEE